MNQAAEDRTQADAGGARAPDPLRLTLGDGLGGMVLNGSPGRVLRLHVKNVSGEPVVFEGQGVETGQLGISFRMSAIGTAAAQRFTSGGEISASVDGADRRFDWDTVIDPGEPGVSMVIRIAATAPFTLPPGQEFSVDLPSPPPDPGAGPRLTRVRLRHGPGLRRGSASGAALPPGYDIATVLAVPGPAPEPEGFEALVRGDPVLRSGTPQRLFVLLRAPNGWPLLVKEPGPPRISVRFSAGRDLRALTTREAAGQVSISVDLGDYGTAWLEADPGNADRDEQRFSAVLMDRQRGVPLSAGQKLLDPMLDIEPVVPPADTDLPRGLEAAQALPTQITICLENIGSGGTEETTLTLYRRTEEEQVPDQPPPGPPDTPRDPGHVPGDPLVLTRAITESRARIDVFVALRDAGLRLVEAEAKLGRIHGVQSTEDAAVIDYEAPENQRFPRDVVVLKCQTADGEPVMAQLDVALPHVGSPPVLPPVGDHDTHDYFKISGRRETIWIRRPRGLTFDQWLEKPVNVEGDLQLGAALGLASLHPALPFSHPALDMTVRQDGRGQIAQKAKLTGGFLQGYSSYKSGGRVWDQHTGLFDFAPIGIGRPTPHLKIRAKVGLDIDIVSGSGLWIRNVESYHAADPFESGGRHSFATLELRRGELRVLQIDATANDGPFDYMRFDGTLDKPDSPWRAEAFRSGFCLIVLDDSEILVVDPRLEG